MTKIVTTQVGTDGVLTIPLDRDDANKMVRVTVESLETASAPSIPKDRAEWLRFLERTAGSITDPTFERQPQGECEIRDSLS